MVEKEVEERGGANVALVERPVVEATTTTTDRLVRRGGRVVLSVCREPWFRSPPEGDRREREGIVYMDMEMEMEMDMYR